MSPRRIHGRELVLGVDGGGTKTRAIITDAHERVLGEGVAGPSNPLRVGIGNAAAAIRDAVDKACAEARVQRADVVAAEVGLAGVRREDIRLRMSEALSGLGIHSIEVVTDADSTTSLSVLGPFGPQRALLRGGTPAIFGVTIFNVMP